MDERGEVEGKPEGREVENRKEAGGKVEGGGEKGLRRLEEG